MEKKNASISTKTDLLSFNTIRTCGQLWSYSKVVYHVVALALFVIFFFFFFMRTALFVNVVG